MANNENVSVTMISQPFTLSWPEVMVPKAFQKPGASRPTGEPEYSFEAISDLDKLEGWNILDKEKGEFTPGDPQKRCVRLAKERWGEDFDVIGAVKAEGLSWPFKSGTAKADGKPGKLEHYRGRKSWRAHAKPEINGKINEPSLYEAVKGGKMRRLLRSTEAGKNRINELFYGGALCTAEVSAVAMQTPQGKFITLYFNSLCFEANGERLGGVPAMERLRGVEGGESNIDPSEGMPGGGETLDDEIPF